MTERRYNILNNTFGWAVFAVAAVTYLLTLEPSASFWDCGEYIAQSYRMEVGHPPGNPFFALMARFFSNFASSPDKVAICINAMSALLSAATILLLFWTITHLARRLLAGRQGISRRKAALIFGSGVCGALAYTWSDTFWFSAVEAEVYAFSSFCTALTFWLILKWENRSDDPRSDRYLIAIAYIVGLSIGVHLLNLLCVPAIALVVYYKRTQRTRWWMTLSVLLLSFAIIVFILYGMVPGFLSIAQQAELLFVNHFGFKFNSGIVAYTISFIAIACWSIFEFHRRNSDMRIKISFFLLLALSGIFFIGDTFYLPAAFALFALVYLFYYCKQHTPIRAMRIIAMSLVMIFAGFSTYAVVMLRSSSKVPMNVNAPDNVFSLSSYIARDQFGDRPLFYGPVYTINNDLVQRDKNGHAIYKIKKRRYEKVVKTSPDEKDKYIEIPPLKEYQYAPEMYMFLPRVYNPASAANYKSWVGGITEKEITAHVKKGDKVETVKALKPSYWDNIKFFAIYQVGHMYWRYLMWNFVGRQNDICGNGEVNHGNWLSGIPWLDNIRLGDQSLLPEEFGKGNAGHNLYYGMPFILGLLGLLWQGRQGRQGKRQCWIVFMLFFMTGIAIVLYLNQIPGQARERDYSFAGSFYAFSIWIGLGVIGLYRLICKALRKIDKKRKIHAGRIAAGISLAAGILIPLQMVGQTWDDHDRRGRTVCRDYAMNILSSVDQNSILFISGDNNSFPVWYIQDTEGFRTDVRTLNTDYLSSDWYIMQAHYPYFEAPPIPMIAAPDTYAYKQRLSASIKKNEEEYPAEAALKDFYDPKSIAGRRPVFNHPVMAIDIDADALAASGRIAPEYAPLVADRMKIDLLKDHSATKLNTNINESRVVTTDIIVSNIAGGWQRPINFVKWIASRTYSFASPYIAQTGLALEVTPFRQDRYTSVGAGYTDKAYDNITKKFRWSGLDTVSADNMPYLDEINRDIVTQTRLAMLDLAERLIKEGEIAFQASKSDTIYPLLPPSARTADYAIGRFSKARDILLLKEKKLPEFAVASNYEFCFRTAEMLYTIGRATGNQEDMRIADNIISHAIDRFSRHMVYFQTLTYWQPISDGDQLLYDDGGFLRLLATYAAGNPNAAKKKIAAVEKAGVDIWSAFRRTLDKAAQRKMPRQPNDRLFSYVREAGQMLSSYDQKRYQTLLNEKPEYKKAIETADEYWTTFETIRKQKLLAN